MSTQGLSTDLGTTLGRRIHGLNAAANRTGLHIESPINVDSQTTSREIHDLQQNNPTPVSNSTAACWVGHLRELQKADRCGTLLLLETDADWDERIKSQMNLISPAVRQLTGSRTHPVHAPYGWSWDLLWLGHCGDSLPPDLSSTVLIDDASVPLHINAWERRFAPHARYVHDSTGPVCTYAYAVTRHGARKILATQDRHGEGVDVWLSGACRRGEIRCITVNPEVFHHQATGNLSSLRHPDLHVTLDGTDNIDRSAREGSRSTVAD